MELISNNSRETDNNMISAHTKPLKPENRNDASDGSHINNEQTVDIKKISMDGDVLEISSNIEKQTLLIRRESVNDKLVISEQ